MSLRQSPDQLVFDVTGMDCGDCARSVERVVAQLPEVADASVSFGAATLTVNPAGGESEGLPRSVEKAVDRAGYTANLRQSDGPSRLNREPWWKNRKLVPTMAGTALWIVAFAVQQASSNETVPIALFVAAILVGGLPIARAALQSLVARRVDMNVLMTVSVTGAAIIGEWSEGALVVVLFTIGTSMQSLTLERTRSALRSLLDLAPEEASVLRDGVEMNVRANTLKVGDLVRVRPGERIPADGDILAGMSALNESAITGESLPVEKGEGDDVFAGSLNGSGVLTVRVTTPSSESTLAKIVHLVEEAQSAKAPSQQLVDRFASIYTPVVIALAAAIAVFGWLVLNDAETWFYRALVLLVISCPCALVISTPVSIVSAIGAATRQGMLVKGGAALEEAGRARLVAFDKTGTLTMGRPVVTRIIVPTIHPPEGQYSEEELLALASAVERESEHPLARAVVAKALHDHVPELPATNFQAIPGHGARATVDNREIAIGNDRLMRSLDVPQGDLQAVDTLAERSLANAGETALIVAERRPDAWHLLGLIAVADRVRPGADTAISRLHELGIERVVMMTGDRQEVAETIGSQVGVDDIRSGLLPHEKAEAVSTLQAEGWGVMQVGDGINDAPALATANVGVAMGMGGTDVALESADLALMRDDLWVVGSVVDLSRRTVSIIRQNISLSLVTKLLALVLALFGFVNLWIAVLADVGTSVIVTLNGLRLARVEKSRRPEPVADGQHDACGCGGDHHAHAHDAVASRAD